MAVESEFWIDTRTGDQLVGEAAIAQRLQESSPGDLVPIEELITAREFKFTKKDFEKQSPEGWTRDDYLTLGRWALSRLERTSVPRPRVSSKIVKRLYILGIGPEYENYSSGGGFNTMAEFQHEVGSQLVYSPRGHFDDWKTRDFVNYAKRVEAAVGGKPQLEDYEEFALNEIDAPTLDIINQHFTVSELNEYLGYPNVKQWSPDDFIEFGVCLVELYGFDSLNMALINALSKPKRQRGPSYSSIISKFKKWDYFKLEVKQRFDERQKARQRLSETYHQQLKSGALPESFNELSEDDFIAAASRYALIEQLGIGVFGVERERYSLIRNPDFFVAALLRARPRLLMQEIEEEAEALGLTYIIWPNDDLKEYLKIPKEEIESMRQRRNKRNIKNKTARRGGTDSRS